MEILFTEIVKTGVGPLFWVSLICTVIFGLIFAGTIDWAKAFIPVSAFILAIVSLSLTFSLGISGYGAKEETRHYITIDDSIPFSEINEKYEIIEQKDKIYIVKERE